MTKPDCDDEKVSKNEIDILKKLKHHDHIIELHNHFYYKDDNKKYLCMVMDKLGCDLHILKDYLNIKIMIIIIVIILVLVQNLIINL